ncbi:MAG: DUF5703 domain-containing protein [Saccharofermentanales bacterium]
MINKEILQETSKYNIRYSHPGDTDRSAMPVGNGDLALSVWTTASGIHFYIAKSDAQTEYDRNVKLGKVSIMIEPNVFCACTTFTQTLDIVNGTIRISASKDSLQCDFDIMVDTECNNVIVHSRFSAPVTVKASYVHWRTQRSERKYPGWDITESDDKVMTHEGGILFYHKNDCSIINKTAELEAVGNYVHLIPDTISNRIFGGLMKMKDGVLLADSQGIYKMNALDASIIIACDSRIGLSLESWTDSLNSQIGLSDDSKLTVERIARYWNEYFSASWVFINGDIQKTAEIQPEILSLCNESTEFQCEGMSAITRGYLLTKWMFACCSNGKFPVHYNGMLFNLMPGNGTHFTVDSFGKCFTSQPSGEPDMEINPDERSWCIENLWQNLRHPFYSMPARGETDRMQVLFKYFNRFKEINRVRAKIYYNAKGQYNSEMTTTFGLQSPEIYGMDRHGKQDGFVDNRAGGAVDISPGLELVQLMFEYYDYTKDNAFLNDELLPYLKDLLQYIETRFTQRDGGKIVLRPLHCVETYRGDVRDPVTVVAGLIDCLDQVEKIRSEIACDEEYSYFNNYRQQVPELLINEEGSTPYVMPAARYINYRENVECPELYTIFPFRRFGFGKEDIETAKNTFWRSMDISGCYRPFAIGETPGAASYSGWQFIGTTAALLGITNAAKDILTENCALNNPGCRFPAMWGPIYDAVPDTDHGANILNLVQWMLFQTDGNIIYVFPAWPREWDACFKFHAPDHTTVEVVYRDGIIEKLEVSPEFRTEDIRICLEGEYTCLDSVFTAKKNV